MLATGPGTSLPATRYPPCQVDGEYQIYSFQERWLLRGDQAFGYEGLDQNQQGQVLQPRFCLFRFFNSQVCTTV